LLKACVFKFLLKIVEAYLFLADLHHQLVMQDDRLEKPKTKKRRAEVAEGKEDSGESEIADKKRLKIEEEVVESPLAKLPLELLYSIHLYAKNPAFTMINRQIHNIFSCCPTSIKARYLIARWHEAYCYGFLSTSSRDKETGTKKAAAVTTAGQQSDTPSGDLLQNGSLPELSWSSRFLPVLPVAEWPYPLSQSTHRSSDHYILDTCLRYPICSQDVLRAVEDIVLASPDLGNIVMVTGLWRDEDNVGLCTYDVYQKRNAGQDEPVHIKPSHLMVNELPKRLFRGFNMKSLEDLAADQDQRCDFDPELVRLLGSFGAGPLPSSSSLLLLLEIISLHFAWSLNVDNITSCKAINSFEGLPLAKSTFQKSHFMVQLLLCLGADVSLSNNLSLLLAIRSGWLEGLQLMVERDQVKLEKSKRDVKEIRAWYQRESNKRRGLHVDVTIKDDCAEQEFRLSEQPHTDQIGKKRRRLADRVYLNTNILKEAVKHNQWPTANWIRSKGVVPDLRTIKLIELKGKKESGS
jgi:hypothetical protein